MKVEITLNGVKVFKDIPNRWEDITFKQFIALNKCGTEIAKILSLFTGIEETTIRKSKIENLDFVLAQLGFLNTKPEPYIPKEMLGYQVPKDLGFETIGQLEDVKDELKKVSGSPIEEQILKYPLYCAIYACKPYEWEKAQSMQDEFLNAPCLEVLGIGNFTLLKLIGWNLNTAPSFRKRSTRMKSFKQALTAWRIRLVFILHSYTWRKKLATNEKN